MMRQASPDMLLIYNFHFKVLVARASLRVSDCEVLNSLPCFPCAKFASNISDPVSSQGY